MPPKAKEEAAPKEALAEQPRAIAARVAAEVFNEEWLHEYLESVKLLSRGYPVDHTCPDCGKRAKVYVHVPDFKNINESVIDFWNQAFGRPGTAEGEPGGVTLVIERTWPVADGEDSELLPATSTTGSVSLLDS